MPSDTQRTPGVLQGALRQAQKDLRTSFRDRLTLVNTVLVPLAMYPALFWVLLQAASLIEGQRSQRVVTVEVAVAEASESLWEALGEGPERVELRRIEASSGAGAYEERLFGDRPVDAVLELTDVPDDPLAIHHDSSRPASALARERLEEWLSHTGEQRRQRAAEDLGMTIADMAPFVIERVDVAEAEELGGFVLSLILPLMLILMGVLGAFYPAVDLTAGEHERKTFETTLLSPIPRVSVQLGKVLAVTVCATVAAAMNLLGMGLAANHLLGMMGSDELRVSLPYSNLLLALPLALAFLLFASAVLCACASLARTFKQGQSLLGSIQLLFLLPAVVTSLPGLALTPALAAIPVVGVALGFRVLLRGGTWADLPWGALAWVLLFQIVYAAVALAVSLRFLDQEPDGGERKPTASERLLALVGHRRRPPSHP